MRWAAPTATRPIQASVTLPGSKSAAARSLLLSAIATSPSTLLGLPDGRDTTLMCGALANLGVSIEQLPDGVRITPPTIFTRGADLDCGLSGTVMRFLPPIAALIPGTTTFHGDEAASMRPMQPLLGALRSIGVEITEDSLPFEVKGRSDLVGGEVILDSSASSQFISGLLLSGARFAAGLHIVHQGPVIPSRPHLDMTVHLLGCRGVKVSNPSPDSWKVEPGQISGLTERIEPDLTNTTTFLAAALTTGGSVCAPWPEQSVQPADQLLAALAAFGAKISRDGDQIEVTGPQALQGVELDLSEISEITPVVAALAALATTPSLISGVAHIQGHETNRLRALTDELNNLGSQVQQTPDGLKIRPRPLHGGLFRAYADHRMAHAGVLLGLRIPGIEIDDISGTSKTISDFPTLWNNLLGTAGE